MFKPFGQILGNSSKNPSPPQKFACTYTYITSHAKFPDALFVNLVTFLVYTCWPSKFFVG